MRKFIVFFCFLYLFFLLLPQKNADACTRCVYNGLNNLVVTGRTMDWAEDMGTNLWLFPRGENRSGSVSGNSLNWTSRYGSIAASVYEGGIADGMNEKGLTANLLYLAESDFGERNPQKPGLIIGAWAQYVLDNFAIVSEAVSFLEKEPFQVVAPLLPNGKKASMHLAITDVSGDNAILEYIDGKLTIHHDKKFVVMTNSPVYDQQLALNRYWEQIGGLSMLPGTNRAADRFVRASFYINALPKTAQATEAVAGVFSVIRNVSVPLGISVLGQPNISTTLWRTVSDQQNLTYFFESTRSPGVIWISLRDIEFSMLKSTKKLVLSKGNTFYGNVADKFENTDKFIFLGSSN